MIISHDDAREYWRHPSQHWRGHTEADLPAYRFHADGGVCIGLHPAPWPGVWMAHVGVRPSAWGRAVEPCKRLLREFWDEVQPMRIVAWIEDSNRAALAFVRRVGAVEDGRMPGVVMMGWSV